MTLFPLLPLFNPARFELLHPRVQSCGELAVLTFNFVSWGGKQDESRWNCTEVFRRSDGMWKIIQTHWSMTQPERKQPGSA